MSLDIDLTSINSSLYDECPICLEDLDKNIAITNCEHQFHFECLSNWIYSQKKIIFTCPSCNKNPCEIINVYSKKKSESKLQGFNSIDSTMVLEISNLENNRTETNRTETNSRNSRNNNITNNKRINTNSNSVKVCSLCNIL